jgi:hypothetical protein
VRGAASPPTSLRNRSLDLVVDPVRPPGREHVRGCLMPQVLLLHLVQNS